MAPFLPDPLVCKAGDTACQEHAFTWKCLQGLDFSAWFGDKMKQHWSFRKHPPTPEKKRDCAMLERKRQVHSRASRLLLSVAIRKKGQCQADWRGGGLCVWDQWVVRAAAPKGLSACSMLSFLALTCPLSPSLAMRHSLGLVLFFFLVFVFLN